MDDSEHEIVVDAPVPKLLPAVGPPIQHPRIVMCAVMAIVVTAVAGSVLLLRTGTPARAPERVAVGLGPQCTPALVDQTVTEAGLTDVQRATCLAIAGRIPQARVLLDRLSARDRGLAINGIFARADATADAGHDDAVLGLMQLVLDYDPKNYEALFHVGIAEYQTGQLAPASDHLMGFLAVYSKEDQWRARAAQTLAAIRNNPPVVEGVRYDTRPQNATRTMIGTPDVAGERPVADVQRVIMARAGIWRACFQRRLNHVGTLGGRILERLEIAPQGNVTLAQRQLGSTLVDDELQACIDRNMQILRFDASARSSVVAVPMTFVGSMDH